MNRVRVLALPGVTVGAAALVGACGTTSGTPRAAAAGPAAVVDPAVQSTTLGPIVTDAKVMTLYLYTKDSQGPPTSHCYGTCATEWPPAQVPASGNVQLTGVNDQGVGHVWYAITPAGRKATTGVTATTEQTGGAGANNGSTGYGAGYSSGY